MTQEEKAKAKAYDEALERAKSFQEKYGGGYAEYIFPELSESEDERIRKGLIEYFEGFRMGNAEVKWEGLNVQEVLVWLEKQKEQKHPNGCFTCDEYKKGYEEGRRNGFTAGYNKAMKEVEQKEQKPVVTHGETYHVDTLGTQQVIAGKMPQKPAEWSEEDETAFGDLIWCINQASKSAKDENDMGNIWFAENWVKNRLKSLRPQPKQEWSEEDERTIDDAFCWLCEYAGSLIQKNYEKSSMLYGIANKLKSLHPQYHGDVTMTEAYKMGKEVGEASRWKPTEHQMTILKAVKEYVGKGSGYWGKGLGSLIDDLEKL